MKSMFKFLGIIAIAAIIGFSFTACIHDEPKTGTNEITVRITGDFSDYKGWQADMEFLSDESAGVAKTKFVNVTATTTSSTLTFAMIDKETNKPFETAGTYQIWLYFSKDGEDNGFTYKIDSRQINNGSNTIQFNDFDTLTPAISVYVTGDFSVYIGWDAYITLSVGADYLAYAGKNITAEDTNVLRFPMYDYKTETETVFGEPGDYFIWLWFEKEDEEDVDYKIDSRQIKKGLNTIALLSFTPLFSNLPAGMLGSWQQASSGADISVTISADTILFSGPGKTKSDEYDFFSYNGTYITAKDDEEQITFKAQLSDGKLIIEGLDFTAHNGIYYPEGTAPYVGKVSYFNKSTFTDEDALVTVKLYMKDGTLFGEKECPINNYVVFDLVLAGEEFYFISKGTDPNEAKSDDFVVGKKKNLSVVYDGMDYTNPVLDLEGEWTINDSSGKTIECYGETMSFSTDEDEAYFEIEAYDGETVYALYFEYINSVEATFKAELTDPNTLVISGIGFTETEWNGTYTRTGP